MSLRRRYQFRLSDLMTLVIFLPPMLVWVDVEFHDKRSRWLLLESCTVFGIGVGWLWALTISNALRLEAFWERAGTIVLCWLFIPALVMAIMLGVDLFVMVLLEFKVSSPGELGLALLEFVVCVCITRFTVRLNRKASDVWFAEEQARLEAAREVKGIET